MITDSSCLISRFGDETVRTGVGVLVGGRWTVGRGGVCLMVVTGARGNTSGTTESDETATVKFCEIPSQTVIR